MAIKFNEFIKVKNIDNAWRYWYKMLTENCVAETSRDGEIIGEVINAITVIEDPTRCILKEPIRNLPMRYLIGELLWYEAGSPTLKSMQMITHNWDRMSDDGVTLNSNYGYCIKYKYGFDQWEQIKTILRDNPNSRQAVIHIKEARNLIEKPTKDLNCTVSLQFFIRDEKLYMTTYMRSNDLWMGFPNDVFQFTAMQIKLAMELNVEIGTYTHIAGSLHLYTRDYEKAQRNDAGNH
ncbi:thymidylate synthase [Clostridium sp.]|uniref:thymidylate synthase n=1 Tax=Clostridium sp. TaxID=1506 RepID=UPI001A5E85B8|nr:thymidylate synthase [Clostridium sp.]MBK5234074.1 hypothetical protein [Clostridium sp.]